MSRTFYAKREGYKIGLLIYQRCHKSTVSEAGLIWFLVYTPNCSSLVRYWKLITVLLIHC